MIIRTDHWAKELKGQKEWSVKWAALNDPKLYLGEHASSNYKFKAQVIFTAILYYQPTKWSVFSVINPPGYKPGMNAPEIPPGCVLPTFKITGERHSFRQEKNVGAGPLQSKPEYRTAKSVSIKNHNADPTINTPTFYNAPFAVATPVPSSEVRKLETQYRASIASYNSSLVGARAGGKVDFAKDPQRIFKYPATSSMEYGWNWDGRNKLEIYG